MFVPILSTAGIFPWPHPHVANFDPLIFSSSALSLLPQLSLSLVFFFAAARVLVQLAGRPLVPSSCSLMPSPSSFHRAARPDACCTASALPLATAHRSSDPDSNSTTLSPSSSRPRPQPANLQDPGRRGLCPAVTPGILAHIPAPTNFAPRCPWSRLSQVRTPSFLFSLFLPRSDIAGEHYRKLVKERG